jgi:F-type H+-transporting ATPase subunit a
VSEVLSSDASALIALVNASLVGIALVIGGWWLAHRKLSATEPSAIQNAGEAILDFFLGKAREVAHGPKRDRLIKLITPLLATLFIFILACNMIAMLPFPVVNRPPTSHFGVTLALAFVAVTSVISMSCVAHGVGRTLMHLVWPNPLQWVSEITDVLSLSLRLFGNIAGEYLTILLVMSVVPYGIPLILHALALIPSVIQALVFTLLTVSFLGNALAEAPAKEKATDTEEAGADSVADVAVAPKTEAQPVTAASQVSWKPSSPGKEATS